MNQYFDDNVRALTPIALGLFSTIITATAMLAPGLTDTQRQGGFGVAIAFIGVAGGLAQPGGRKGDNKSVNIDAADVVKVSQPVAATTEPLLVNGRNITNTQDDDFVDEEALAKLN